MAGAEAVRESGTDRSTEELLRNPSQRRVEQKQARNQRGDSIEGEPKNENALACL